MARQDFLNAEEIIQRLNTAFDTHTKVIAQSAEQVKKYQAEFNKLPSGYIKAQKDLLDLSYKQARSEKELANSLSAKNKAKQQEIVAETKLIQQKKEALRLSQAEDAQATKSASLKSAASRKKIADAEKERLADLKLQKQREQAFDKYETGIKKEEAALKRAETAYNRIQSSVSVLTKTYQDLAIRKELGSTLTKNEEAQLLSITNRLNLYQNALKKVDANIGKHQRNVGNYASGFNGLGNAINQLSREAPAFANSVQTGFLALSNNLPILFDEITRVKRANAELIAQGKPVKSVFSQIGAAIFSVGTALSLGVTLLTLYGDEIVEWGKNIFSGSKSIDSLAESTKQLSEIRVESLKSIVQERQELENNLAIAKDTTLSLKDRQIAAQKVLDQYPYWFESLGKEAILNGNVEKAVRGVNDALLARAKANAAVGKITENQGKIIDLEEERLTVVQELTKAETALRTIQRRSYAASNAENQAQSEAEALGRVQNLKLELSKIDKDRSELEKVNQRLTSYSIAQSKEAIGLEYQAKDAAKEKGEAEVQAETNSRVAFERNISALEEKLSVMAKVDSITGEASTSYKLLELQLKLLKDAYESVYGEQEKLNEETEKTIKYGTEEYYNDVINKLKTEQSQLADTSEQYAVYNSMIKTVQTQLDVLTGKKDDVEALNSAVQDYLKSFSSGFLQNANLGSLNFFLQMDENGKSMFDNLLANAETTKERFAITFNAIAEVAQEAFNFINQASQANFEAESARLTQQKDIALKYAGESATAREEIERQYQERQREIKMREWKANRDAALFNIAINTAQGITAALASVPPNPALAIAIGVIGAAQAAIVASREIPSYFKGTDNHPGGLMMVNDAKGGNYQEMVKEPGKTPYIPTGRNRVIDAPKGTKVLTASKTMRELEDMLMTNDIAPFASVLNRDRFGGVVINQNGGGITEESLEKVMRRVMPKSNTSIQVDRSGFGLYTVELGAKTKWLNGKINITTKNI